MKQFGNTSKSYTYVFIWSNNSTPTNIPNRIENIFSHTKNSNIIVTLFILPNKWRQPKYPPADKWIEKMWYVHIGEYYSVITRNDILTYLWMNLKNSKLSKASQLQRPLIGWFNLHELGKSIERENRLVVVRGWGRAGKQGEWGMSFHG